MSFFSSLFKNKNGLLILTGLVFVFAFFPLSFAQADLVTDLVGSIAGPLIQAIVGLISALGCIAVAIVLIITGIILSIVNAILMWLTTTFLSIPITDANIVKNVGWPFTLQLVNMGYLLILAWIGLATILQLKESDAQKTIPKLILNALLVNFSLVLVGFVVDIGNLLTNFFLEQVNQVSTGVGGLISTGQNAWNSIANGIINSIGKNITNQTAILNSITGYFAYGIVLILFNIFATFVLMAVAYIFFIRIIYLWILAIVAPIAFFSKIVPNSEEKQQFFRGILGWDQWWKDLLQWSIVGVPLAFFLYLSCFISRSEPFSAGKPNSFPINTENLNKNGTLTNGMCNVTFIDEDTKKETKETCTKEDCSESNPKNLECKKTPCCQPAGTAGTFTNFIANLIQPFTALLFLFTGLMIAISSAPSAAQGALSYAKKIPDYYQAYGKKLGKKAVKPLENARMGAIKLASAGISKATAPDPIKRLGGWMRGKPIVGRIANKVERFGNYGVKKKVGEFVETKIPYVGKTARKIASGTENYIGDVVINLAQKELKNEITKEEIEREREISKATSVQEVANVGFGGDINKAMDDLSPQTFARKASAKDLENIDIFLSASRQQIQILADPKKSRKSQRQAIYKTVTDNLPIINARITALQNEANSLSAAGNLTEQNRTLDKRKTLLDNRDYVQNNTNFSNP